MQEVGVCVPGSGFQLAPATRQLELDVTATAGGGSRGSSTRSGSVEETSEEDCSPMDLSSGGSTSIVHPQNSTTTTTSALLVNSTGVKFEDHPLFNAKKLAEFVKAQHLAQQQKEKNEKTPSPPSSDQTKLPKKRTWNETDVQISNKNDKAASENEEETQTEQEISSSDQDFQTKHPITPLDLIRTKWEQERNGHTSPDSATSSSSSTNTPASSTQEVKKRRLDALLNKKFAMSESPKSTSPQSTPPPAQIVEAPSTDEAVTLPAALTNKRRESQDSTGERRANRRKQSSPTNSNSQPILSLRPSSELLERNFHEHIHKTSHILHSPVAASRPAKSPRIERQDSLERHKSIQIFPPSPIKKSETSSPRHSSPIKHNQHSRYSPVIKSDHHSSFSPIHKGSDLSPRDNFHHHRERKPNHISPKPNHLSPKPNHLSPKPNHLSPTKRLDSSPSSNSNKEQDALKSQILQLQLAQAALLSGSGLKSGLAAGGAAAAANPLLYYGYYAQMLQGLQSQQQKLMEQLALKQSAESIKNLLSPKMPGLNANLSTNGVKIEQRRDSEDLTRHPLLPRQPSFSPRLDSPSPVNLSPRGGHLAHSALFPPGPGSDLDEPRRRAPRALTGRYVRTGTGASPRTLQLLRKKIQERIKLKELLGENSHLYFGALNKQKKKQPFPTMGK